ncbi:MAG: helix-turn-helix transcriptional regulator [Oscillospiraceae bacterium]|nr:helix-turn-helix transcriptional regulator [Oscillospiraceae bacterium]
MEIGVKGEKVQAKPHACMISAPKMPRWHYFAQETRMHWLHCHQEFGELLEKYHIPVGEIFYPEDHSFLAPLFREIRIELSGQAPGYEDMLDALLIQMLVKLSRNLEDDSAYHGVNPADRKKIREIHSEIISNPEKDWVVADMAKTVNLSVSRFHAAYRAIYDSSPMKDVITARVERAKELLVTQERATMPEIAEQLGYKNQYHFIVQFKSATGTTPGAYRKFNR